ncbi:hypothetical protein [Anaerotignum sp.]|uniref:hypothetical protein n=1 Tax=Anaerotignum sp. TaxID=2039241 RepID=UPI002714C1A1|nr:hypothetical protein [Anaerotignum sp.]
MRYLKNKLNSQKGTSVLLALMLFFVCFMVASAILSSATANGDKLRQRESNQKEFLSVSSAANLLKDIIGSIEYTGWETNTVYECYGELLNIRPEKHNDQAEISPAMDYNAGVEARIRADLEDMVYEAFTSHTQYMPPVVVDKVLTKELIISGEGMVDVKVVMSLNSETYLLTCALTVKDSGQESNAMTVIFKARVNVPSKDSADMEINPDADTHEVYKQVEEEDGTISWEWVPKTYDITVYTIQTQITYDGGTITKGVFP